MKWKSLVAELANRINQPHVIDCYMRKVYRMGLKEGERRKIGPDYYTKTQLGLALQELYDNSGITIESIEKLTDILTPTDTDLQDQKWDELTPEARKATINVYKVTCICCEKTKGTITHQFHLNNRKYYETTYGIHNLKNYDNVRTEE